MRFLSYLKRAGVVSALFIFGLGLLSKSNIVTALDCKDINVIFARGSGQNITNGTPIDNLVGWSKGSNGLIFDRGTDFKSTEPESTKYFEGIGNRILQEYPTLTMQFVSLHDFPNRYNGFGYRAVNAFGSLDTLFLTRNTVDAKFGSNSIISESTYGEYRQSVKDGAEELAGYLEDEMVRCPNQYTVVGGYSQGAQVVGEAMALMHAHNQDTLLAKLGHVDMFGDPKFNGFELTTSGLNPLQKHVTLPWVRGSANVNEVGSLGPRKPYVPDILTAHTTSWCDFNDVVCGGYAGLSVTDINAHSHVYKDKGGWIEKSTQETYIDMKHRLSLLAGVADKSANSPFAYWPGVQTPSKIDIMFVMDSTADESLSLVPDPAYLANNFNFLTKPNAPDGTPAELYYSSIRAGVATYTEFQDGPDIVSFPKVPVAMTDDVFAEQGAFQQLWGQAHFLGNNVGGLDFQDSPYGALKLALDQTWRSDARHVIMLFSNSWGKDVEPRTNYTMKQITAIARAKNVEILPAFTSKTMRANPNNVQNVPLANAFYTALAKQSEGHMAEVTDKLSSTFVYDLIMGHVLAPDVDIAKGADFVDANGDTASRDMEDKTTVFKTGDTVVLSASDSSSPVSDVAHYAWDINGDGVIDYESDQPYIEFTYNDAYSGQVCVTVTDAMGNASTGCVDVGATSNDGQVTDHTPAPIIAPDFHTTRSGNDLIITWPPTDGYLIFEDTDGGIIIVIDAHTGLFTLKDVPKEAFSVIAQLAQGDAESEPVVLQIEAAPVETVLPPPTTTENPPSDSTTTDSPPANDTLGSDSTITETLQPAGNTQQAGTETNGDVVVLSGVTNTTGTSKVLSVTTSPQSKQSSPIAVPQALETPLDVEAFLQTQQFWENNPSALKRFAQWFQNGIKHSAVNALQDLSEVVQDFLAWLIILVLLLVWLYLKMRKRDQENYQYMAQKKYA